MSTTAIGLEQELESLNRQIEETVAEASRLEVDARNVVEKFKADGVNPLTDKDAFEAVDAAYKPADAKKQEAEELRERALKVAGWLGSKVVDSAKARGIDPIRAFTESAPYLAAKQRGDFDSGQARIEIPGVEVLDREIAVAMLGSGMPLKAATLDGGDLIASQRAFFPPVDLVPVRQPVVLDLVTVATTDSNLIEYVQLTTRTDAAAPTALGTAYPEATYAFDPATAAVKDIGQWIPAHRSQLADAGQLRGLIENLLETGVRMELEEQVISGDGTGENLSGIIEEAGQGVTRDTTNERRLEAVHRGITAVRLARFGEPDGVGMHPTDYEEMLFEGELGVTGLDKGNYLLPSAVIGQTPRSVWGLPIAVSTAFPEGTGVVGQWKAGATVYIRSGVAVRASDSHSDFFVKRMVAILAETRAALAVYLPDSFCLVEAI